MSEAMETGKSYHMGASVRGMLNWDRRYTRRMMGTITNNGVPFKTVEEFRDGLMDLLTQGIEMIPCGACDNFDPKTGCKGHPTKAAAAG